MAKIVPYKTRIRGRGFGAHAFQGGMAGAFLLGALVVGAGQFLLAHDGPLLALPKIGVEDTTPPTGGGTGATIEASFAICGAGPRINCVVDGDTFWTGGIKVRIADIDAPETHPPRCEHEAELGAAATQRLKALLNEGPFALKTEGRDEDQYGRKLRVVTRDGRSLGGVLVSEGLAREWTGRRMPWCGT
jgi:endonuclease YncB( thermonuclease family)